MKKKECKYCNMTDMVAEEWMATRDEEFGRMIVSLDVLVVEEIDKGPALGITLGDFIDETIPINYCPMCGRKLVN